MPVFDFSGASESKKITECTYEVFYSDNSSTNGNTIPAVSF